MKEYALIVAGGMGIRMAASVPKQFLHLLGKPLLMHTLESFKAKDRKIILVIPEAFLEEWNQLCTQFKFDLSHLVVKGGNSRFYSVKSGLESIHDDGWVAIHDGVRPLAGTNLIDSSYQTAKEKGNAVAAIHPTDSLRKKVQGDKTKAVDRDAYYLVQTPQTFKVSEIKSAYSSAPHDQFTDDAGVFESAGGIVNLIEGHSGNIKITTPIDLEIAAAMMKMEKVHRP